MRWWIGAMVGALALPWAACEDKAVDLSQEETATTATNGGNGGNGGSGTTTGSDTSNTVTGDGGFGFGPTSGTQGFTSSATSTTGCDFSGHGCPGSTNSNGSGGTNSDGVDDGGDGNGGTFPQPTSTDGFGEGGQPPICPEPPCGCEPDDTQCLICIYARADCRVETPDCGLPGWDQSCRGCTAATCYGDRSCFKDLHCLPTCSSDEECLGEFGERCDPEEGVCVQCYEDAQCEDDKPICLTGQCVECEDIFDCGEGYCIAGECQECVSNADCGDKYCTAAGECVECLYDGHCEEPNPVCKDLVCRECREHGDCDPGEYCSDAGRCE